MLLKKLLMIQSRKQSIPKDSEKPFVVIQRL